MRKGFTLLEVVLALLFLSLLALFVLRPFTEVLLTQQETAPLEAALIKAQDILEGYRATPPIPVGCSSLEALEGGLSYQVCTLSEGSLVRYEVRVYRGSELITAWVTHQ
ncbi:prepilin-type N-terminal cleavage/methylation domain-containing protein [Calidithermus timidus]|uniref:prepilin-type N-terminal cleavage/methylation domain-containing protein n=1 Tax=Calidithermus timidus TaxID=307124 RepID=UPI0003A96629|nr:prepilin-type N-terminal cleavage/methylation domain-containing protein [Calidithermus timidus]